MTRDMHGGYDEGHVTGDMTRGKTLGYDYGLDKGGMTRDMTRGTHGNVAGDITRPCVHLEQHPRRL